MTYFRIQDKDDDPQELIGRDNESWLWVDCGQGARSGVSVCESLDDLYTYFSYRDDGSLGGRTLPARLAECQIVEMEGEVSEDDDHDADAYGGPVLVHPTEVVSTRPVTIEDVIALCWYDRTPDTVAGLAAQANHLLDAFSRGEIEEALGLGERTLDHPALGRYADPGEHYVVGELVWNSAAEEYEPADEEEMVW